MLALYSLRPRSTGPWERRSREPSDLAEMEKAAQLCGLAEALSLQPPPLSGAWPAPFPLTLGVLRGAGRSLAAAGFSRKVARKASWARGCCRRLPFSPWNPAPCTHLWWGKGRVSQEHTCTRHPYIMHTATSSTHDTLTHSPFTQPSTQVHAHTHWVRLSPLPPTWFQTQAL